MSVRTEEKNAGDNWQDIQELCHSASYEAGWWDGVDVENDYVIGTKMMLIVSEIAEAMEGHRKWLTDDKLPHRPAVEVELADAIIRIADLGGAMGLDVAGAITEKLAYNRNRADHRPENRAKEGGKRY